MRLARQLPAASLQALVPLARQVQHWSLLLGRSSAAMHGPAAVDMKDTHSTTQHSTDSTFFVVMHGLAAHHIHVVHSTDSKESCMYACTVLFMPFAACTLRLQLAPVPASTVVMGSHAVVMEFGRTCSRGMRGVLEGEG